MRRPRTNAARDRGRRGENQRANVPRPSRRWLWGAAAALIVVGSALYANSVHNPFVFDDHPSIVDNANIGNLWPLAKALQGPPGSGASGRPVVALSLALNHALSGLDAWSYHLFNIGMHILTGLLLFSLVQRTLASPRVAPALGPHALPLAFLVTLLWLVHPLQTAALNHVIYRSEILAGFFCLLTLAAASRASRASAPWPWNFVAFLSCALGMASKETMVVTPILVLLYDRAFVWGSWRAAWRQRAPFYSILASTWGLLAVLVATADRGETVGFDIERVTWTAYALTQSQVVWTYLRLVLWPAPLVLHYDWEIARSVASVWPFLAALALLLGIVVWALRSRPVAGYAGAWFFLLLAPTSTVIPLTGMVAAEHRLYLPLAGPMALAVCGLASLLLRWRAPRTALLLLSMLSLPVAGALAAQTVRRNRDFQSEVVLWQDVVKKRPRNARAHANLAGAFIGEERFEDALVHYREALRLRPQHGETAAHIAAALVRLGRFAEAVPFYERALQYAPDVAATHSNYASLLTRLGRFDAARRHIDRALQLRPGYGMAHFNRAQLELAQGGLDSAIVHFQRAAAKMPSDSEVAYHLASAYLRRGDYGDAVEQYKATLAIQPHHVDALNNVAWLLATCPDSTLRDHRAALASVERALQLEGGDTPGLLDTQAAALAAAGRFETAIAVAERAVQLAANAGDAGLSARIAARIQLYRAGRAFRMAPAPSSTASGTSP